MLANLSRALLMVTLPSGGRAVYDTPPNRVPRAGLPESLHWPMEYGQQIAHEIPGQRGQWCRPGGWEPITDARTLALIDRVPEITWADVAPLERGQP